MHRRTLYSHVAALHELPLAVVEDQLNCAFEHDAEVDGLRPVHHTFIAGCEIDLASVLKSALGALGLERCAESATHNGKLRRDGEQEVSIPSDKRHL
jgi:hypothetical protein